jgi:HK97 family phage major capsid protein
MKTAKDYLEGEVKRLVDQARGITRGAEEENRGLSDEERMKVEGLIQETNTLKARISEQDENERLIQALEGVSAVASGQPTVEDKPAKTLGEAFVKSDSYKALMKRGLRGNWSSGPIEFATKLTDGGSPALTVVSEDGSTVFDTDTNVTPQILPGIQSPVEQRLYVADLFTQGTATANAIVYLKETVTDNGALDSTGAAVLTTEGALKPVSQINFDKVTQAVDKIATFLPISDEMLEDEPQVASYINGRLSLFIRQAEEAYLVAEVVAVAGTSSSAGELDGDNIFDGIAAAIMHVRVDAGLEPDGVLVSPLDAARMDVARAVGGTGTYFSGGPYGTPSQNPWGLRRVVTTAVEDGAPIVGAFREGATLWRKGGISVEASNSHADYFRRNLTALRAEERLALTIFRDDAFQVVSEAS